MDKEPLLDLSLMYSIFDTYREKVLAGCPEGFDLQVSIGEDGSLTITFTRDRLWLRCNNMDIVVGELLVCLSSRLRYIGWRVWWNSSPSH